MTARPGTKVEYRQSYAQLVRRQKLSAAAIAWEFEHDDMVEVLSDPRAAASAERAIAKVRP